MQKQQVEQKQKETAKLTYGEDFKDAITQHGYIIALTYHGTVMIWIDCILKNIYHVDSSATKLVRVPNSIGVCFYVLHPDKQTYDLFTYDQVNGFVVKHFCHSYTVFAPLDKERVLISHGKDLYIYGVDDKKQHHFELYSEITALAVLSADEFIVSTQQIARYHHLKGVAGCDDVKKMMDAAKDGVGIGVIFDKCASTALCRRAVLSRASTQYLETDGEYVAFDQNRTIESLKLSDNGATGSYVDNAPFRRFNLVSGHLVLYDKNSIEIHSLKDRSTCESHRVDGIIRLIDAGNCKITTVTKSAITFYSDIKALLSKKLTEDEITAITKTAIDETLKAADYWKNYNVAEIRARVSTKIHRKIDSILVPSVKYIQAADPLDELIDQVFVKCGVSVRITEMLTAKIKEIVLEEVTKLN